MLTASQDGTLKFWNVAKAGATRKYIPKFDKGEVQARTLVAGDETVLAINPDSGSRYPTLMWILYDEPLHCVL